MTKIYDSAYTGEQLDAAIEYFLNQTSNIAYAYQGKCETATNDPNKIITIDEYKLIPGSKILIYFTNPQTPYKDMQFTIVTRDNIIGPIEVEDNISWLENSILEFTYNGDQFIAASTGASYKIEFSTPLGTIFNSYDKVYLFQAKMTNDKIEFTSYNDLLLSYPSASCIWELYATDNADSNEQSLLISSDIFLQNSSTFFEQQDNGFNYFVFKCRFIDMQSILETNQNMSYDLKNTAYFILRCIITLENIATEDDDETNDASTYVVSNDIILNCSNLNNILGRYRLLVVDNENLQIQWMPNRNMESGDE